MNLKQSLDYSITIFFVIVVQSVLCQLNFRGRTGIVYSPNYPENYGNLENITYTIRVPPGYYIHLTFLDFLTEDGYDKLEILKGIRPRAVSMTKLAGEKTGAIIDVQFSSLTMIFTTDLTKTFRGFAIRFDMVKYGTVYTYDNSCQSPDQITNFGLVTSPNFPYKYPNDFSCDYLIVAQETHILSLQFVAFNTEDGYDIVTIYDGSNSSSPVIGKFAGTKIPPTITSTGNSLYIFFNTDLVDNFSGFSGLYRSITASPEISP